MAGFSLGINGCNRLARACLRLALSQDQIEPVAWNCPRPLSAPGLFRFLKYDSDYGPLDQTLAVADDLTQITIGSRSLALSAQTEARQMPWARTETAIVIDCQPRSVRADYLKDHLRAGSRRLVIASDDNDCDLTPIVIGLNESRLAQGPETLLSTLTAASGALVILMNIIAKQLGIRQALVQTLQADLSTSRADTDGRIDPALGLTVNSTSTRAETLVPELAGKLALTTVGVFGVPVALTELTLVVNQATTVADLNRFLKRQLDQSYYQGLVATTTEKLISSDLLADSHSGLIDLNQTRVVAGNLIRLAFWSDQTTALAGRLLELATLAGRNLTFDSQVKDSGLANQSLTG